MDVSGVGNAVQKGQVIAVPESHHFADNLYAKEVHIPAGARMAQHAHAYSHLSILAKGSVIVTLVDEGIERHHTAPACILIEKGKRHGVEALTDSTWYCVHADKE